MSKREDQRIAALAKKNAEKDSETRRLFKEMKKREF
jgi:hypothetical protein